MFREGLLAFWIVTRRELQTYDFKDKRISIEILSLCFTSSTTIYYPFYPRARERNRSSVSTSRGRKETYLYATFCSSCFFFFRYRMRSFRTRWCASSKTVDRHALCFVKYLFVFLLVFCRDVFFAMKSYAVWNYTLFSMKVAYNFFALHFFQFSYKFYLLF